MPLDVILDELCAATGWHRSLARKALAAVLRPPVVQPLSPGLRATDRKLWTRWGFCWAMLGAPTGKRLAPVMGELVPRLQRFGELEITDETAALLVGMSAATMDRRLVGDRAAPAAAPERAPPPSPVRC